MAFKSKIKPAELKDFTQEGYIKILKKEVGRAAKFGETGVVILSDYVFSCGSTGTMMILGKMSGPLLKYYKQMKKERSQEKDFAKGTCYFEETEGEKSTMRIALDDGKGKPARMLKNGKPLFKKLGVNPDIFKGKIDLTKEELQELEDIQEQVDEENDDIRIQKIIKQYKKAFARVVNNVAPLLKNKEEQSKITEQHYQLVIQLLRLSQSLKDKYEEEGLDDPQGKREEKIASFVLGVIDRTDNVMRMASKIKKLLKNTVETSVEMEEDKLSDPQKPVLSDERRTEIEAKLASLKKRLEALAI